MQINKTLYNLFDNVCFGIACFLIVMVVGIVLELLGFRF